MIMQQSEKLTENDLSFLSTEQAKVYLKNFQIISSSKDEPPLDSLVKMTQDENILEGLRQILANLLTVNPYFRWTAVECLAHPIFDDVRDPDSEKTAVIEKIKL